MEAIIRAGSISKTIGGKTLFQETTFDVYNTDCIGIIGPNGCGKTSLFRILLEELVPDEGELWIKDALRIRNLPQTPIKNLNQTVDQYITTMAQNPELEHQLKTYEKKLEDPAIYETDQYKMILDKINALQIRLSQEKNEVKIKAIYQLLKNIKFTEISSDEPIKNLSGGEQQKLALASVLVQPEQCDLLLLDEPTNHLDIETIEWLENRLVDMPFAVLIVSHDEYLLDNLVDRVFDFQADHIEIFDANYETYLEQNRIRLQQRHHEYKKAVSKQKQQEMKIKKMTRRNRYDKQIKSKLKRLEKIKQIENPVLKKYMLRFSFQNVFKSGKNIADGTGICKQFDDKIILDDASFEIFSGQKIGLIGPNGCGKTTFLKMLTGEETLDKGTIHMSGGVRWGYFDQGHLSLKKENTLVAEVLKDHHDLNENDAKAILGQFNFRNDKVYNTVGMLSGGEQARLALLKLLMKPYNFLILDEPTNHMDMTSKKAIESALQMYAGTVIAVSHDRTFMDNVADTIFFMDKKQIKDYPGNYTMFRLQRQKELVRKGGMSDKSLAYLSKAGLKRYKVVKSFTEWNSRTKHKVGDMVYIGDHNEKLYECAIENGWIKEKN